jgi:hypothetical protein
MPITLLWEPYQSFLKVATLALITMFQGRGLTAMTRITRIDHRSGTGRRNLTRRGRQTQAGAAIAELGPAMWILLFGFFFPVLVLVSMLCTYGSVMVLNYCQVHEAALLPNAQAKDPNGAILKTIPTDWQTMGLGRFCRVDGLPTTQVSYKAGETDQNKVQDWYVWVTTTCKVAPLVKVPFLIAVPGLNEEWQFTVSSNCVVENQDNASP